MPKGTVVAIHSKGEREGQPFVSKQINEGETVQVLGTPDTRVSHITSSGRVVVKVDGEDTFDFPSGKRRIHLTDEVDLLIV